MTNNHRSGRRSTGGRATSSTNSSNSDPGGSSAGENPEPPIPDDAPLEPEDQEVFELAENLYNLWDYSDQPTISQTAFADIDLSVARKTRGEDARLRKKQLKETVALDETRDEIERLGVTWLAKLDTGRGALGVEEGEFHSNGECKWKEPTLYSPGTYARNAEHLLRRADISIREALKVMEESPVYPTCGKIQEALKQKIACRARNKTGSSNKAAAKHEGEIPSGNPPYRPAPPPKDEDKATQNPPPTGTSPQVGDLSVFFSSTPHMGLPEPISEELEELAEEGKIALLEPSEADSGRSEGGSLEYGGSENNVRGGNGSENNVWKWRPGDLKRRTCDRSTRRAIFEYVPSAEDDDIVFRYCVYRFWSDFTDDYMGLPVLPESACNWIAGYENNTAIGVIEHIQKRLGLEFLPHIPKRRCRLIKEDGLPEELKRIVDEDMSTPPSDYDDRVYLLSGAPYTQKKVTKRRQEIQEGLAEERHKAPSVGAQKTFELLNFGCGEGLRPSRLTSKMMGHLSEAYAYVRQMEIDPDTSKQDDESWVAWQRRKNKQEWDQRQEYFTEPRADC